MVEGKENLSTFLSLVKELKECISTGKTGDYHAVKMFEMSEFIENISKDIYGSEYRYEMNQRLLSDCNTSLEEVTTISNELLTGYLLLKISEDSTRSAISEFISRFGDSRFSSVCVSLIEKRQIFLSLSSLLNNQSTDDLISAFLLQLWTKHIRGDPIETEKASRLFDSMLQSKNSFDILARTSNFDRVEDWKPTINLIYTRAYLKLKPYEYKYWSWLINSKDFFNNIVKNNINLPQMLFDFIVESCSHSIFDPEKSQWINPEGYLSICDIVAILHNLMTLECTFNKTKNFIDEQKVGLNPQFWLDVENNYIDFRTKSQSFLHIKPVDL